MKTTHTPGPWQLHSGFSDWGMPCQHDVFINDGSDERDLIAGIPSITPYCMGAKAAEIEYADRQAANARLIAASPDMLEALEGILNIGKRDMSNPKYDGYFASAQAAIQKARGKQ